MDLCIITVDLQDRQYWQVWRFPWQRSSSSPVDTSQHFDRRALLLGTFTFAAALALERSAQAEEEGGGDIKTFWGLARPPTSYGAYAGGDQKNAKYVFDYPPSWKVETVGKNEKGMQGIDCRVRNKIKGQSAYTVTFGRAGEDNKSFRLGDVDQTLQGFAGADYDLQDALVESTNKASSKAERHGQSFYDYELAGPGIQYLATVTERGGKVYAFFVKSPTKNFTTDEAALRSIVQSFRLV
ncbi:hypothetical protein CVIRNUC_000714 [Coccomyxa viridis]|uniref:PsbP C-terminal domain-containing protein n=1 Tax=Coccomyxa viridis TaxID=1274662 RepID=A0AAV1HSL1_9CHLO|nr:hypothetical protein CVIRNUC_000714 [Coccomyxa viridis]